MLRSWLAGALAAYDPADPVEAAYLPAFRELVAGPGAVFDDRHFQPGHVTASAFVAAEGDSVLLVHHAKLDKWIQPGGHVETHDPSLEGAARREVAEEVGLHDLDGLGLLDLDIHEFPERGPDPAHLHFDVRFAFVSPARDVAALDGVVEARWVSFSEVPGLTKEPSVMRPVEKLRRLLR